MVKQGGSVPKYVSMHLWENQQCQNQVVIITQNHIMQSFGEFIKTEIKCLKPIYKGFVMVCPKPGCKMILIFSFPRDLDGIIDQVISFFQSGYDMILIV